MKLLRNLDQYRKDIFTKMNLPLEKGLRILDLGCGDGSDCKVFLNIYKLDVYGVDIFDNPKKNLKYQYKKGTIYKIPYKDNFFDYIFLHNVLHHIDEPKQRFTKHCEAMSELKRVCKKKGKIFILEGNRYNPLFYPHMVLMEGHNHFRQSYFLKLMRKNFKKVNIAFFESHFYPPKYLSLFKIYEKIMDKISPNIFKAYNFASIENDK